MESIKTTHLLYRIIVPTILGLILCSIASAEDADDRLGEQLARLEREEPTLELYRSIGKLYLSKGDLRNAAEFFHLADAEPNAGVEDVVELVKVYAAARQFEGAMAVAKDGLKRYPNSAELFYVQGMTYEALGKAPTAMYVFSKAAKQEPENPKYNYKLAEIMFKRGNLDRAETIVEPLADQDDPYLDAVLLYGQILFVSDRERQGIRRIEKLFKTQPENQRVRSALVTMLLKNSMQEAEAGRVSRAVSALEDANGIVPREVEILMGLALLENEQGNPTRAMEYCQELIEAHPKELKAYEFLGRMQRVEGQAGEAEATFRRGLTLAEQAGDEEFVRSFNKSLKPLE